MRTSGSATIAAPPVEPGVRRPAASSGSAAASASVAGSASSAIVG